MSPPTPSLCRMLLALAVGIVSCAGSAASPASAEPAPRQPHVAASRGRVAARPPRAIGTGNAERVRKVWEAAAGGFGRAVALSRALGRVAYSNGVEVLLYDLRRGQRRPALTGLCGEVVRGGLAFLGNRLMVVCEDEAQVVTLPDSKVHDFPLAPSPVTAVGFTVDRMVVGHHDGVVRIYSAAGGAPTAIAVPGPPIDVKSLALSPDGRRVAVAWIQGSIWWWDVALPSEPRPLVRHPNESDAVAFSADGQLFAEEGEANATSVWSFSGEPTVVRKIRNGSWLKRIHFTRDSSWLVRGGSDGLELAEIGGPRRVVLDTRGAVEDVALDEHGATLAAVDRDGRLTVWAPP